MQPFGQIITFYSYKGGTGRSMSMANVGYLLASSPVYSVERLLLIDWDLEAPGLHRFFRREFPMPGNEVPGDDRNALRDRPGLIDFLSDIEAFYRTHAATDELPEGTASTDRARGLFEEALQRHPLASYWHESPILPKLHLLTAGSHRSDVPAESSYAARVRRFEWDRFYFQYGSFFTHFREYLMREFQYVLIDSRTGLTDTAGICTRVMPEKLVAVFVPNRQNIEGITNVIRQAVGYRSRSRDIRGLMAFPLASRIDASNQRLRQVWWHGGKIDDDQLEGYQPAFERLFRELYDLQECKLAEYFNATQVPHDSDYAFGESIAARLGTADRFSIGGACANLVDRLVRLDAPWEEIEDLRTQYEQVRSTAEEHARRADLLEARIAKGRRRVVWVVAGTAGLALTTVGLTLGLGQLSIDRKTVGMVVLAVVLAVWMLALGVRQVQRLRADARAAAEEKG